MIKIYTDLSQLTPQIIEEIISSNEKIIFEFSRIQDENLCQSFDEKVLSKKSVEVHLRGDYKTYWTSIKFLENFTHLKILQISNAQLESLNSLTALSRLESLSLHSNYTKPTPLEPIAHFKKLNSLAISGNLTDYGVIARLSNLHSFGVRAYSTDFDIGHILPIISQLKSLDIGGEEVVNMQLLSEAKKVKHLVLNGIENTGEKMEFISHLSSLVILELDYLPQLRFLPTFADCKKLGRIVLEGLDGLENLENLKGATSLVDFCLLEYETNQFSLDDFKILTQLPQLKIAHVDFVDNVEMRDKFDEIMEKHGLIVIDSMSDEFKNIF